jgi:glycosyltransferase involved in cell wall biosynthesis
MRLAAPDEAAEITEQQAATERDSVEVAWLGARPEWLDGADAAEALDGVTIASTVSSRTRVVHLARHAPSTPAVVRAAHPDAAIVVDLGDVDSAPDGTVVAAADADAALVESELDALRARDLSSALDGRITIAPSPIDLAQHAPEDALNRLPGAHIRRFRRLHRLAHPAVLFVGPYTEAGGLDLAIAATYRLREQFEDVRLAAIPLGGVDQKYLDRCEMDALALGHRGIVEWTVSDDQLPFWYATATVVCSPWREPGAPALSPTLAAAAARPFVGSDLDVFRFSLRPSDAPGLVPADDLEALVSALTPLLADAELSTRLGEAARAVAEEVFSYEAAATRLAGVWRSLAERSLTESA